MVPRKANTPTLQREQIVHAAIGLVDRDGLDALSMRKLAAELGVGVMSLYYHVPDKSALYDLILEAVMCEIDFSADDPSAPAEERLVGLAYALRRALLSHPHAVPIALSRSLTTPVQLRPIERMLGTLFEYGFEPVQAVGAVEAVGHYVLGSTMAYVNYLASSERAEEQAEAPQISPEEFPNLMHAYGEAGYVSWDDNFDVGIRSLVRGLVQLAER